MLALREATYLLSSSLVWIPSILLLSSRWVEKSPLGSQNSGQSILRPVFPFSIRCFESALSLTMTSCHLAWYGLVKA